MREILTIIDLELTDLDIDGGARVVSLGAVRLGHSPADDLKREWFFNPEGRKISPGGSHAQERNHDALAGFGTFKKQFNDIALFLGKARLVHHCPYRAGDGASVHERALNAEFARAGHPATPHQRWINLQSIAQRLAPDANSLDDMMLRYRIHPAQRGETHGALRSATITAAVLRGMWGDGDAKKFLKKLDIH